MVLRNLGIGARLTLGFAVIVVMMIGVIALGFFASQRATSSIGRTVYVRTPAAQTAAAAEASLLKMLGDLRGYLALGQAPYKTGYFAAEEAFAARLTSLKEAAAGNGGGLESPADRARLEKLERLFEQWKPMPPHLFTIREDQLKREPALGLLITQGTRPIALTVTSIKKLLESQRRKPVTPDSMKILSEMAEVQSAYLAMISGLRAYITTGRENFKFEYDTNLAIYRRALAQLDRHTEALDAGQRQLLKTMATASQAFEPLPGTMFEWIESDRARMDLFLFRSRAVPIAEEMLQLLSALAAEQQMLLRADLTDGNEALSQAQLRMLVLGVIAALLASILAWLFRANVVGPIRRLTAVAAEVGGGNLAARAPVESEDEIGLLARTFNDMNARLGESLADLDRRRKEQKKLAEKFRRQSEYLGALHDTGLALVQRLELQDLLSDLVSRAGQLLGTTDGYIYLVDPSSGMLIREIGVGQFAESIGTTLATDQGLAGRVWTTGQPLVINDYQNWEGRYSSGFYSHRIKAMIGVPLQTTKGVIGVLGLAYELENQNQFGPEEIEILDRFARLAAISLENARLYSEAQSASRRIAEQNQVLEALSNKLSKYLSPQVYASIFAGRQDVQIASRRKKLTVFFSDIAGFAETTESLESEELTALLNHYLTEMSKIALDHGATIDKYIGDAILAFFGDPESKGVKEDALACVSMAIEMQRRMADLQSQWRDLGSENPFQLRIGITTGFCTVGNFGSNDRMDYTIIGSEVNLAARLQSLAEVGSILMSHQTYALVKDEVVAEEQDPVVIKGFARPVRTYRVLGLRDKPAEGNQSFDYQSARAQFYVDLASMSEEERAEALRAAEYMLKQLRS